MDHTVLVHILDRASDSLDQPGRLTNDKGTILQAFGQRRAFHKLHREVVLPARFVDLVHGHDVGMLRSRRGTGLRQEPPTCIGVSYTPDRIILSAITRPSLRCRAR